MSDRPTTAEWFVHESFDSVTGRTKTLRVRPCTINRGEPPYELGLYFPPSEMGAVLPFRRVDEFCAYLKRMAEERGEATS